jgi:hypothetical protein
MDYRDELAMNALFQGEDKALENITIGMVKQDNIECCVCLNFHWGVKLPNCNHFICPKCYYRIYNGYIGSKFHSKNLDPKYPEKPIYPYQNQDKNKEIFYSMNNNDDTYLEWFIHENEDLYNLNKELDNLDGNLKDWFKNNELIKQYDIDSTKYRNDLDKYWVDIEKYNNLYKKEKELNSHKICPLCRG